MYRSGDNDIVLEAASNFFYRQNISDTSHRWYTNGADEKLMISGTGALYLGTTTNSNSERFHIHTASSEKAIIKLTNTTTGVGSGDGFEFGMNGNEQIEFVNKENTDMFFATNNTERLRINSSGAVMINTTNSANRTLNLNGTFGILSTNQSGVIDMSVTDAGVASIGPYVAGGSSLELKTNASGSGVATRLSISKEGYVTKPAHPSFYVRRSTGGDGRSAQDPVTEWANPGTSESSGNPVHNRGGHFNYTTGLFTAPVNGIYHFSAAAGYKQSNVDFNQKFVLNGGEMAEGVRFIGTPLNSHSTATISATCYMAANTTMGVKIQTTHHVNTTLNFFCGHLVA